MGIDAKIRNKNVEVIDNRRDKPKEFQVRD